MPGIIPPGPAIGQLQGGKAFTPSAPAPAPAAALPPDVFRGYADLRNSTAHHLNRHLYNAAALDRGTLSVLARKRKVRR